MRTPFRFWQLERFGHGLLVAVFVLLCPAAVNARDSDTELVDADDAASDEDDGDDLDGLDLEDLMNLEVTLVSGEEQTIKEAPAAVFVITSEDIRRGGFTSIPDALRLVPGMQVGRVTASEWSVSARGFGGRFASRMLVLFDGRAVYNDVFAGVFWAIQDYPLEDIDRIEVIRGPGATIWGANAVNGVINIVTKSVDETQGWSVRAGGGDQEKHFGSARFGHRISDKLAFRIYAKEVDRNNMEFESGANAHDDNDHYRLGGRIEGDLTDSIRFTLSGDYHDSRMSEQTQQLSLTPPLQFAQRYKNTIDSANVIARLEGVGDSGELQWSIQGFVDRDRVDINGIDGEIGTVDLDFRSFVKLADSHSVVWGVGYRRRYDRGDSVFRISFVPDKRDTDKYSAFIQDTITLTDNAFVMVGTKVERNQYTGWEIQPSLRGTLNLEESSAVWFSVSRAVRTPSRTDANLVGVSSVVPAGPTGIPVTLVGDSSVDSEEVYAYELGYRSQPTDRINVDISAFYNHYDNIITPSRTGVSPVVVFYDNAGRADVFGVEISSTVQASDRWRLHGSYSWLNMDLRGGDESAEHSSPENTVNLRSEYDITDDLECNAVGYYVDQARGFKVGSYFRVDAGLTWRPQEGIELSVWGQNLTESHHAESNDSFWIQRRIDVPRSVYGQVVIRF